MPKLPARDVTGWPRRPRLPCSWGDVFDRLTILQLKRDRITDPVKRRNVEHELAAVGRVIGAVDRFPPQLDDLVRDLGNINATLWDVEDSKRACERQQRFDDNFIALARSVYLENDRRAGIKKQINLLLGSDLVEEKSHADLAR